MSAQRILIIEDEPDLLRGLALNLKAEGYDVLTASRGDAGIEQALRDRPELVLLDVMLPGMNGLDVCRELRRRGLAVPIVMLTAKAEEVDRVVGLELGADDYVTKPFGMRELLARIRARLRRHAPTAESEPEFQFGEVELDLDRHVALRDGRRVELTGKEFDILRFLASHCGEVVTRDQLLEEVWGYESYPTTRTVDNHILRLRQKLEDDPSSPRHILSIYGEGYKLVR
jgi:DNA-binding response OmpR family regulator